MPPARASTRKSNGSSTPPEASATSTTSKTPFTSIAATLTCHLAPPKSPKSQHKVAAGDRRGRSSAESRDAIIERPASPAVERLCGRQGATVQNDGVEIVRGIDRTD